MELRIHRFRHVHDVSVLSEKVFSFIRMRQLLYFAFGVLVLWRAMSFRDPGAFMFSTFIFIVGAASAVLSRGSCSFEARLVLSLLSIVESLLTPKHERAAKKPREKQRRQAKQDSATNTSSISRVAKDSALSLGATAIGLALFTLSVLTLFGFETPLAVLGVYGLTMLAGVSTLLAFTGFFMFLCGALGNPLRRKVVR